MLLMQVQYMYMYKFIHCTPVHIHCTCNYRNKIYLHTWCTCTHVQVTYSTVQSTCKFPFTREPLARLSLRVTRILACTVYDTGSSTREHSLVLVLFWSIKMIMMYFWLNTKSYHPLGNIVERYTVNYTFGKVGWWKTKRRKYEEQNKPLFH